MKIDDFSKFKFSKELADAIRELGFTAPTPIQQETIPLLLKQKTDFLGLAATGTGKTAAFAIPLLENLNPKARGVQALILCPTRELAKQVAEQINLLARYKKTKALAIYGGSEYGGQFRALKEGVSIVVGTPGRIIDHLERGSLILDQLQTVILDEADEMISMGFKDEIEFILERVNQEEKHSTWLFSATMSREVRRIADHFLDKPKQIQINKSEVITQAVKQFYYYVREEQKPEVVQKLIDEAPAFYGLIFCQTKMLVDELTQMLKLRGYRAEALHGDMDQTMRERVMKSFKSKAVNVLVCTDVASRGIDVKELSHVINYSIPRELDNYVHRIGRTGRGGKEGIALSLVTKSHLELIGKIEKAMGTRIEKAEVPTDDQVLQNKVNKLVHQMVHPENQGTKFLNEIKTLIDNSPLKTEFEAMEKNEIIARFLLQTLAHPKKPAMGAPKPGGAPPPRGFGGKPRRFSGPARGSRRY